jgi:hypothetical protein
MKITLCVDRIEGDVAVLGTGSGGKNYTAQKVQWPGGLQEGDWVIAELEGEKVTSIQLEPNARKASEEKIHPALDKLHKRPKP